MNSCNCCKWLFRDDSVGYRECTCSASFTDEEYEVFEENDGCILNCPYFEEDGEYGYEYYL